MVSPLELLNQAGYGAARRGVTYRPPVRIQPPRAAPAPERIGTSDQPAATAARWLTPNMEAIAAYQPPQAQAAGGGNQFGPLGFVIGGLGKIGMGALNVLDRGRRASILAAEGAANVLPEELEWLYMPSALVNEDRDETRSAWERFNDPMYGWGQVAKQIDTGNEELDKWLNRGQGLVGDIALDPLTYLTFGTGGVVGKSGRASALAKLGEGQLAAVADRELVDELTRQWARRGGGTLTKEAQQAAEQAAKEASERVARLGGERELEQIGQRGLSIANPEQLSEMGLRQHSMRFAGRNIPGTEGLSRALSVPAQRLRPAARAVPGASMLRELRTPEGYFGQNLNPAYERIITGGGAGTMRQALESLQYDTAARQAGGTFEALANRELRILRDEMKALSHSEQQAMIREAERGADNAFSRYATKVRDAAKAAGADIPELKPVQLADGGVTQYAMPHVLSRQFRDYLQGAAKGKYEVPAAEVFKKEAKITTEDLLEEGGFLQQRRFTPSAEPYKFGDREILIEEGTIDELNRKFKALFPEFEGQIYETDPTTAWRHYINRTRSDVANMSASRQGVERGFDTFVSDPGAPTRYDPYGARQQVTTRVEEGQEVPVTVPVPNKKPMMTPEQARLYKTETTPESTRATRERNQAIRRSADIERAKAHYAQESLASREKIATGLDDLTQQVYDPIRTELDRLEEVAAQGNEAAGQMVGEWRAAIERRAQIPREMGALTRQINKLEQQINEIRRTGTQFVPGMQKEMLDELERRRTALIAQRKELIDTFEMDLQTTPMTRALHNSAIDQLGEQAISKHTETLQEAARKAKAAYDNEVERLKSSTPGMLSDQQVRQFQAIVDNAPPEVRDVSRRRGALGHLAINKARIDDEIGTLRSQLSTKSREVSQGFEKLSDEELNAALQEVQSLRQQIALMEQEAEALKQSIKRQKGADVLTREEADYDEAFRKLRRHNLNIHGTGGILEGTQPLLAQQRAAEHNLREWEAALRTERPGRAAAAMPEAPATEIPAHVRRAAEQLQTAEAQKMGAQLDRLAQIEAERANWIPVEQLDEKLKELRRELRLTERGATEGTATERMAARNQRGDIRRAIEAVERDRAQTVDALKALDKEQRKIARQMSGKSKLRAQVEQARRDVSGVVEPTPTPRATPGAESAAQRQGRVDTIKRLQRDRDIAERLRQRAIRDANRPIPPPPLKRVRGGWYRADDGFQIIRNDRGTWQVVKPGEFTPSGDEYGLLATAKEELARIQANPEWMARRQQQATRVPEYDRQVANINEKLAELERVDRPLAPAQPTVERTVREAPPRGFGSEMPPPKHPKLREIEQSVEEMRKARSAEGIEEAVLREHMPGIHLTEQELADVVNRMGGTITGTGYDEAGNAIPRTMARAEQQAAGVAINEARDAMDTIDNLTGQQLAKGTEREALRAEQGAVGQRITEAEQGYIGTLQSQEAARAENQRIVESVGGEFLPPDNAARRVARNKKQAKAFGSKLEAVKAGKMAAHDAQPLAAVKVQIDKLIDGNPLGDDAEMLRLQRLSEGFRDELAKLTKETDIPAHEVDRMVAAAKSGKLAPIVDFTLQDGLSRMWKNGDVIVSDDVRQMFYRVREGAKSKGFGRLMKMYTDFFKTYATLSPGFHVRNALSAIFMNYTEGVKTGTQMEAMRLWREFANSDEPVAWFGRRTPQEREAFRAVFASGSGGQFFESGVGSLSVGSTRVREGIFANRLTKGSQRLGQDWVEGPVRLALALDSTKAGRGGQEALERITRIHFDYGQVSRFDERMKRYIPFWTFMSRNLPLQITQMWTKPKFYAAYNSFKRNFSIPAPEFMPEYIEQAGGFQAGTTPDWLSGVPLIGTAKDMPFVLQPDLPQTRLLEDINRLAQSASGENAGQLLSDFNPAFTAPLEFLTSQDFYTGRRYQPDDITKVGLADLPFLPLAAILGETETGPGGIYMSEKARNTARALIPPYDRAVRMIPGLAGGGGEQERQLESFARFLGMPIRTISEKQMQSEQARRYYNARDQARVAAAAGG